jgi:hypothetical protein
LNDELKSTSRMTFEVSYSQHSAPLLLRVYVTAIIEYKVIFISSHSCLEFRSQFLVDDDVYVIQQKNAYNLLIEL